MKDLLTFLLTKITGIENPDVDVNEEDGYVHFDIKADPNIIGLIIGKQGKTIKMIRKILRVRATTERKKVDISVSEA